MKPVVAAGGMAGIIGGMVALAVYALGIHDLGIALTVGAWLAFFSFLTFV